MEDATTLFHALAGAHFMESGPWAVAHFWAWLADSRELDPALQYMPTCDVVADWTDTYTELHWIEGWHVKETENLKARHECDADALRKLIKDEEEYLVVVYKDTDNSLYRKGERCAEELRYPVAGEGWREIVWDPNMGSFCSPTRHTGRPPCAGEGGMQLQPLPSKVTLCLYGSSLPAHATLRRKHTDGVAKIVRLRGT